MRKASALPGQGVRRTPLPGWGFGANRLAGVILPLTGRRHAYAQGTRPLMFGKWGRKNSCEITAWAPCMHARHSNHMQGTATAAANNRHHLRDVQHIGSPPPTCSLDSSAASSGETCM